MATRVFHPCQFHFGQQDIRVVGQTVSGGTSLSGIEDTTETTGGGYWRADYASASFGNRNERGRAETLAWRALNGGMIGGSVAVIVQFCDRWHQPVGDAVRVPHSDGTPFSDDSLYVGSGASATIAAVVNGQTGGNRCTVLDIRFAGQKGLLGGERFSYVGADGWGDRAAEIYSIEDRGGGVTRVTFQPPIRGGVAAGQMLDFDNIRCRMRRTSEASNAISQGIFGSGSLSFVEDMRPPVVPE